MSSPAVRTTKEGRSILARMGRVKTPVITKEARKQYSEQEKRALIDEDGEASNSHKLRLDGAGYDEEGQMGVELWLL